ncbi:MAG: hypothetical protein C5B49_05350 [Bdellovibrio sp.]|nr:MAG: hypothetical protein C5B49_05350 [Bdellovibrio sp.]
MKNGGGLSASGLSAAEVEARLKQFGFNEIAEDKWASSLAQAMQILSDPMGLMMLILSIVYWVLGETSDSLILLVAYVPIIGVDVLLELRSQKALRALKKSISSRCYVIRAQETVIIPTRELVPGDLLILEEGQTVAADGVLLESANLTMDESSLTGESIPVEKRLGQEILSGTRVLTGRGVVEIVKTGLASQIGAIAKVLREFEETPSPWLRTVRFAVKIVVVIALGLAAGVFALSLWRGQGVGTSLIAALTLAMAAIPEEFPLVFTLYLSLAAARLSKKGILVKSLPAIEGLGRLDVLCTDKTGTLTEGQFRLERIFDGSAEVPKAPTWAAEVPKAPTWAAEVPMEPPPTRELARILVFACEPKPVDAMEAGIMEWVARTQNKDFVGDLHAEWDLRIDYPFKVQETYMSHVWKKKAGDEEIIAVKGGLEGVLAHCDSSTNESAIWQWAQQEAGAGRRLLGLATRRGPFTGVREQDEMSLNFVGVLSFADPVRPGVKEAVLQCVQRGIQIKMLTGDHLLTAHAIADRIALPHRHDQLFVGPDLEGMEQDQKREAYRKGSIFARLRPEQKLELVRALKSAGQIVAMTGDGINDAPALKLADVGISMGERATDIAQSTAQLVLLKNNFSGIVDAILEGQGVLQSLGESFGYLIAFHIPIVGIALYQSFMLGAQLLLPIHIVLLELVVHPVSAFAFAEIEGNDSAFKREFISRRRLWGSVTRGVMLTALAVLTFYGAEGDPLHKRSLAVLALVIGNVGLLLGEKGGARKLGEALRSTRVLSSIGLLTLLTVTLAFSSPVARLFSMESPSLAEFVVVFFLGLAIGFINIIPSKAIP